VNCKDCGEKIKIPFGVILVCIAVLTPLWFMFYIIYTEGNAECNVLGEIKSFDDGVITLTNNKQYMTGVIKGARSGDVLEECKFTSGLLGENINYRVV